MRGLLTALAYSSRLVNEVETSLRHHAQRRDDRESIMPRMAFFMLLVVFFALLHVPPLARVLGLATRRDRMRGAAGFAFIVASLPHFVSPERYAAMMPAALPWPMALIYLSG